MKNRLTIRWHLRQLMAAQGMFQTTELVPLLAERDIHLSREQVFRLVTKTPQRLNMDVLAALCDIFGCVPNDLIEIVAQPAPAARTGTDEETSAGLGNLRPVRARVRRPEGS